MKFGLEFTSSSFLIDIHPTWDFDEGLRRNDVNHATINQRYADYTWGTKELWVVPVHFMTSSESDLLNDWWRYQRELTWTVNSTAHTVKIANQSNPVTNVRNPYQDFSDVNLRLEAV